jgi:hypothetical protein
MMVSQYAFMGRTWTIEKTRHVRIAKRRLGRFSFILSRLVFALGWWARVPAKMEWTYYLYTTGLVLIDQQDDNEQNADHHWIVEEDEDELYFD